MSDILNLNDAPTGGTGDLIPDGTVARAIFTIRPGGAGDSGWLKPSRAGDLMVDAEWTITDGPFARRKVWGYMMVTGNETAVSITHKSLRAVVEGHYGIKPDDMSPEAQDKRRVTLEDLNGMNACILVGVEPAKDGYDAKNKVKAVLAPGDTKYLRPGEAPTSPASGQSAGGGFGSSSAPQAGTSAAAKKPSWA